MVKRMILICDTGRWTCTPENFGVLWNKLGGKTVVRTIIYVYEDGSKSTHNTSPDGVFSYYRWSGK